MNYRFKNGGVKNITANVILKLWFFLKFLKNPPQSKNRKKNRPKLKRHRSLLVCHENDYLDSVEPKPTLLSTGVWCLNACTWFSLDPLCCSWARLLCPTPPQPSAFPLWHFSSFLIIIFIGHWLPQGPQKLLESQGRACFSLRWVSCAWQVQNRKTFLLFSWHCCWQTSEGMEFGQWCLWTELWHLFLCLW